MVPDKEIPPPPAIHALFEERRFDFLRFAEFFLLNKRPYGVAFSKDGDRGYINTAHATQVGSIPNISSAACDSECDAYTDCNAYQFDNDNSNCNLYRVNSQQAFIDDSALPTSIGYNFKKTDKWAVSDLSELPIKKKFFREIANMSLLLKTKHPPLRQKSNLILDSNNIKYCYETEPTSDLSLSYIQARNDAIQSLERAIQYFLFNNNYEYPNKNELVLGCIELLNNDDDDQKKLFKNDAEKLEDINKTINYSTLDKTNEIYRSFVSAMNNYDTDNSGFLSKQEYRNIIEKDKTMIVITEGSEFIDKTITETTDATTCLSSADYDAIVDQFFAKYDTDHDNRIYPFDLMKDVESKLTLLTQPAECF